MKGNLQVLGGSSLIEGVFSRAGVDDVPIRSGHTTIEWDTETETTESAEQKAETARRVINFAVTRQRMRAYDAKRETLIRPDQFDPESETILLAPMAGGR